MISQFLLTPDSFFDIFCVFNSLHKMRRGEYLFFVLLLMISKEVISLLVMIYHVSEVSCIFIRMKMKKILKIYREWVSEWESERKRTSNKHKNSRWTTHMADNIRNVKWVVERRPSVREFFSSFWESRREVTC